MKKNKNIRINVFITKKTKIVYLKQLRKTYFYVIYFLLNKTVTTILFLSAQKKLDVVKDGRVR